MKLHIFQQPKPCIGIISLPGQIMHQVVMDNPMPAYFFAVYPFFKTVVNIIISYFKIGGSANRKCFMRCFPCLFLALIIIHIAVIIGTGNFAIGY